MSTNDDPSESRNPDSSSFPRQYDAIQSTDHSPKFNQSIVSNDNHIDSTNVDPARIQEAPKEPTVAAPRKDLGKPTVTMRELLSELKNGESPAALVASSPHRSDFCPI